MVSISRGNTFDQNRAQNEQQVKMEDDIKSEWSDEDASFWICFCAQCHEFFDSKELLERHNLTSHSQETIHTHDKANKDLGNSDDINTQQHFVNMAETPFLCKHCDKSFKSSEQQEVEIKLDLNDSNSDGDITTKSSRLWFCDKCNDFFETKPLLESHGRAFHDQINAPCNSNNADEKPFVCKYCGDRFSYKNVLVLHIKKHINSKPARSNEYPYFREQTLSKINQPRNFDCKDCGKLFIQKCDLDEHHLVHIREKPFVCGYCQQRFSLTSHFESHEHSRKTIRVRLLSTTI
ncbi:hypothetical protein QE152_g4264 [Popillia japonica]|uniref:C2H2-type domain-containing protein n=1 Tax=Popillia japonica TaxID=7064 RepID=A0AAW1N114_POPJA